MPLRPMMQGLERRWLLSAGDVDRAFGEAGRTLMDLGGVDVVQDLTPAGGGAIVAVGISDDRLVLARLKSNGRVDRKFGSAGKVTTTIPGASAASIAVSPEDGRIAVTCMNGSKLTVALFDSAGNPIASFGNNGVFSQPSTSWMNDRPRVLFNNAGDLLVAAVESSETPSLSSQRIVNDLRLMRLSDQGSILSMERPSAGRFISMVRAPDGSSYLAFEQPQFAGPSANQTEHDELQILRRTSSGEADEKYGSGGKVTLRRAHGDASLDVVGMHAAGDGSLTVLASERVGPAPTPDYIVYRLRPDGSPAAEPVKLSGLGGAGATGFDVLENGKLMVFGQQGSGEQTTWFAARFRADGTMDRSYGNGGITLLPQKSAPPIGVIDARGGVILTAGAPAPGDAQDFSFERLQGGTGHGEIDLSPRGTLTLTGTDDNDTLSVTRRDRDGKLVARVNDDSRAFTLSRVKRIAITASDGNDTATINDGIRGVYIDGGSGNDTLHGGGAADFILGGEGKDHLFGNGGNDTLLGGLGNDYLVGGAGKDMLIGNGGVDTLSGGGGHDRLFGGGGTDHLIGGAGIDSAPADLLDHRSSAELTLGEP